jgi:serine/threonine protein kinase
MPQSDESAPGSGASGAPPAPTYATTDLGRVDHALGDSVRSDDGHPKMVGRYRLVERIGEGGMGLVFRAQQEAPIERTVALKLIRLGLGSPEVVRRFESERQALAWMDHPHIAKVLDAGADPFTGQPYFVMDYVTGRPITDYCDEHRMNNRQRLELFLQVCDAVAHAHQKMVVHRDLKPSNILVSSANGPETAQTKVIDFGIAKALVGRLTDRTMFTESGQMVGTPEYMSPEQARNSGPDDVDTRSDIYSLGVVLYELLTGALPFDPHTLRNSGLAGIERMICEVDPPRPSTRLSSLGSTASEVARRRQTEIDELARQLKSELEWIPLKAMRKDRTQRYATAQELAGDIRNYLAGRPLTAAPESRAYRAKKFLRRNRVPVAVVALFVVLLVTASVVATWLAVRAERQRRLAEARFNDIREFSSSLIFDVHNDVAKLAGSQAAVDKLLNISVRYLQKLNAETSDNYNVLADASVGYQGLGDMQRNTNRSDGGDVEAAQASYEKAKQLASRALAMAPHDLNCISALGTAQMRLARLAETRGDYRAALDQYNAAYLLLEQVATARPRAYTSRRVAANVLSSIAETQERLTSTAEAVRAYERALTAARALCADFPEQSDARDVLAAPLHDLAELHLRMGNWNAALAVAQEALESQQLATAADPDSVGRQIALADTYTNLARVYEQQERRTDAIAQQEQAIKIAAELLGKDPANLRVQAMAAHTQVRYAELLGRADRFDEARRAYDQAISVYGKVLDQRPKDITARRMRLYAIASLGDMLGRKKQFREAAAYHRKAIEALEPMLAATPNDVAIAGGMAYSCAYAGQFLLQAGDADGAVPLLRRAVELNEKVVAADPANAMLAGNLADTRITLGDALRALGARDPAREQYLKAKAILLPLVNQNRLSNGRKLIDRVERKLAHLNDPTAPTTEPDSQD